MKGERRRLRNFWAGVVDDPYRKLVAVGLAIMMWFFITSRITKETQRWMTLTCVGSQVGASADWTGAADRIAIELPTDRVVGKRFVDGEREIEGVHIVLSGPRFRVDAVEDEALNLVVTSFMSRDWSRPATGFGQSNVEFVEFTVADIRRDLRALQELRIEMIPPRVRLEIERRDRVQVELGRDSMQVVAAPEIEARLLHETTRFTPNVATILGPAIGMEKLASLPDGSKLFRVNLQSSGNDRQARGQLEIIDAGELGVYFETPPVVDVQLRPQTDTFMLELPFVVDDLSLPPAERGRYRPAETEATRTVRVQVAGGLRTDLILLEEKDPRLLQEWAADNLRLQVYVPRPTGVGHPEVLVLKAYLVPIGPVLAAAERGECVLEEVVVVTLRRNP